MHCTSEGLPIRQQCLPEMFCQKSCLLRDGYSSSPNKRMNVLSGGNVGFKLTLNAPFHFKDLTLNLPRDLPDTSS